jgi:hypothetical protein
MEFWETWAVNSRLVAPAKAPSRSSTRERGAIPETPGDESVGEATSITTQKGKAQRRLVPSHFRKSDIQAKQNIMEIIIFGK